MHFRSKVERHERHQLQRDLREAMVLGKLVGWWKEAVEVAEAGGQADVAAAAQLREGHGEICRLEDRWEAQRTVPLSCPVGIGRLVLILVERHQSSAKLTCQRGVARLAITVARGEERQAVRPQGERNPGEGVSHTAKDFGVGEARRGVLGVRPGACGVQERPASRRERHAQGLAGPPDSVGDLGGIVAIAVDQEDACHAPGLSVDSVRRCAGTALRHRG